MCGVIDTGNGNGEAITEGAHETAAVTG